MATSFTVFTASNRNPNVNYSSATYTIPDNGDKMVKFTLANLDIVDEPDTTVVYWAMEKSIAEGQPWSHMVGGDVQGRNGVPSPKPPGTMATNIDGIVGQRVRGSLYFVTGDNKRRRFGVSGETY